MITSRNLGKLVTHLLICSLLVAGLSGPTTRASRAYANHLPPPPAVQKTADQAVVPRAETLDDATRARVEEAYVKLPLSFEENRGQVDAEVKYLARGAGYTLFLTQTEAVLSLRGAEGEARNQKGGLHRRRDPRLATRAPRSDVLRMKLKGANRSPAVTAENRTGVRANYFKGNDPKNWHTGVARFERVRYADVYPGVDVIYYGQEQQLEYDFEVAAGADAGRIVLEFAGVGRMKVERGTGELVLKTAGGEVRQRRPVTYQEVGGERREVASRYVLKGRREVGIEVGEYDRTKSLVIDPVLTYSTYLGGSGNDIGNAIAVDASGNAYVAGFTQSPDFPTFRQYKKSRGVLYSDNEAFVFKINTNASGKDALLYSTYLGGAVSCCAVGTGIALDSSGIIYVTGATSATDFPMLNSYQTYRGGGQDGSDAFLVKLDPNLSGADSLLYSTYLGGSDAEFATGVAADSAGNAYITGYTASTNFPTINQYGVKRRGLDAFVTRINTNASGAAQLVYSTFLGGSRDDFATGIAADSAGHAYVSGYTASTDFPMRRAYKGDFHTTWDYQRAAFVTKLDTNLAGTASLLYSTYLVGSDDGYSYGAAAWAIAADSAGNVYVTGQTGSSDFPTLNQYQTQCYDESDAFVTKLDTNLSGAASLRYSTYLCGGGGFDEGFGIAVDSSGNVYVTGFTVASDFPELNPSQKYVRETNGDAFVAKLNPNLASRASLIYSTTLIGENDEKGVAIAVDSLGNAYVTGETRSGTFPQVNPYPAKTAPGSWDGFVTKLTDSYTVRGRVTKDGLTGVGAVTVTLTGSKNDTFVTNSNGEYFFAQLITGGDYTVTPSKGDLTFTPSRRRFTDLEADQPDVDFRTRAASVSGRVTIGTAAGEGLAGVTLTLTGGTNFAAREVKSSSTGAYSFGQLPTPGSYKVTPSKVGYRFGPEQAAVINLTTSRTGVDFTASLKTYTVSGVVKSGASGLGGVTVKLESPTPGGFTARGTTTNSAGAYSFPNVPAGRSYTVTPVKAGYQFTPVGASLADLSADHTNVNFAVKVYSITGRVVRAGTSTGIGAVTLTLTSPTPGNFAARTAQTSSTGYYTFTNLPAGRSYTLKPAKSGFTFSPATRGLANLSGNVPAGTSTSFTGAGP